MHYTGTIWRPPYEASSLLLEVTAGCTHHKCKFCTLYDDLPFSFRMSPLEVIEDDLKEAESRLQLWKDRQITRTFLTGANPFVLKTSRLIEIAERIQNHFPGNRSIGCFSRITDITLKSDKELLELHAAGYDYLTIGVETGDDNALEFMNKGYLYPSASGWIMRESTTISFISPAFPAQAKGKPVRKRPRGSATNCIPKSLGQVC